MVCVFARVHVSLRAQVGETVATPPPFLILKPILRQRAGGEIKPEVPPQNGRNLYAGNSEVIFFKYISIMILS